MVRSFLVFICLAPLLLTACGTGLYKVPTEEYRKEVKTLGVLPVLVDGNSTILHPQRDEIITMLQQASAGREERLIDLLRKNKNYFDVRAVKADPVSLAPRLIRGSTLVTNRNQVSRQYQFDPQVLAELTRNSVVDGLLIVVLNGVEQQEKRWDRTPPDYLESRYNNILATAVVVNSAGKVFWEYPGTAGNAFLNLQYAAFDEAHFNKTEAVKVYFLSPEGVNRTLTEPDRGLFGQSDFPSLYRQTFEKLAGALATGLNELLSKQLAKPATETK